MTNEPELQYDPDNDVWFYQGPFGRIEYLSSTMAEHVSELDERLLADRKTPMPERGEFIGE